MRVLLLATTAFIFAAPAYAQSTSTSASGSSAAAATSGGQDIVVTGELDKARASVQAGLGATTYSISNDTIQAQAGGDNIGFDKIALQLPGVVQDGGGQIHVRGDHANLEYRINGAILPEGVSSFGQTLSPRIIQSFELRTGALPAQYGLRTAGIIDITTKNSFDNSGDIAVYGGSHGRIEPSFSYGGSSGNTNYFVTGSYLRDDLGIEAVDANRHQIHDTTEQYKGFAYIDRTIGANDRVSLLGGYVDQWYQIPNPRGLHPTDGYDVGGVTDFLSNDLNERQHQRTAFAIASYLHNSGPFTLQTSLFGRWSALDYYPDTLGELLFNGIAQRAAKRDFTAGIQVEGVYHLSPAHTLRGGVIVSRDRNNSQTSAQVFPVDSTGAQTGQPITIVDNGAATEMTYSAYLQDEWKLSDTLTLNYGLRYDLSDGFRREDQLSPRINAVWKPNGNTTFHAGYSRFFSPAPFSNVANTTIAKFASTSAAAPGTLNTTPYAERQDYFDIGLAQTITPTLSMTLDVYHRRSTNLVDEGQFGAPIILTPFNYAKGRIDGVEGNLTWQSGPWMIYGNLAWSKAQGKGIVSGQFNFDPADLAYIADHYIYLDHDQRWTGSAGATYQIQDGALADTTLGASMIYGSGLRTDGAVPNGGKLPPYATVNLSVSHTFERPGIELRFDVINVGDHVYEIRDGSGIGVGAPQYGERRSFFVGITKTF